MAKTKVKEVLNSDDSKKEKFDYLWDYYKWHFIIVMIAVLGSAYAVYQIMTRPVYNFHITVISEEVSFEEEERFHNELNEYLELENEPAEALASFTPMGVLSEGFVAQWTAGEFDLILLDEEAFELYATEGTMQEFQVDSGLDEEALSIAGDEYDYPMAIDANEFPLFDGYLTLEDLYVTVPENTENTHLVTEFFRMQGFEIELID